MFFECIPHFSVFNTWMLNYLGGNKVIEGITTALALCCSKDRYPLTHLLLTPLFLLVSWGFKQ